MCIWFDPWPGEGRCFQHVAGLHLMNFLFGVLSLSGFNAFGESIVNYELVLFVISWLLFWLKGINWLITAVGYKLIGDTSISR